MRIRFCVRATLGVALVGAFALPTNALTIFTGGDPGAGPGDVRPNADFAAAAFDAAANPSALIDFESLSLGDFSSMNIGSGVTATFSGHDSPSGIRFDDGGALGFNTTAGGRQFLAFWPEYHVGTATLTLDFVTPIDSWGAYFTGLEPTISGDLFLTYADGSGAELSVGDLSPEGVQFFGFTDMGNSISQITFELRNVSGTRDIFGIDDMRFGSTPVPEPATITLLGMGLGALVLRRKRQEKFAN